MDYFHKRRKLLTQHNTTCVIFCFNTELSYIFLMRYLIIVLKEYNIKSNNI